MKTAEEMLIKAKIPEGIIPILSEVMESYAKKVAKEIYKLSKLSDMGHDWFPTFEKCWEEFNNKS